jgi:putative nucleotidyltransferase with HDIG domain
VESKKIKVPVEDLRLGMYVAELDRPWVGTRFMYQGFAISSVEALQELQRVCQFVYVDINVEDSAVARSKDTLYARIDVPAANEPIDSTSVSIPAMGRLLKEPQISKHQYPDETKLEEELETANEIEQETRTVVYSILEDARLGKGVNTTAAKQVVGQMVESIVRNPDAMVVMSQLKNVDEYTALHSVRVCILAVTFGRHLELTREELELLGLGALLHDVGKMKVPLEILNKPDKLTENEFEIMKGHVPLGMDILLDARGVPHQSLQVVERHHERYGGRGYVRGITGDAIGSFGMIGAIVDCYDAVTSDRVYHRGMSAHEALTRMYEWRTKDFHPGLLEQFIQCMGIYPIGSVVELNTGAVGVIVTVNRERRLKPRVALVMNPDKRRYKRPKTIDLAQYELDHPDKPIEISKVLPHGAYGIYPVDYLPLKR